MVQVRSDYEQLRRTFVLVRRERDAARQDRTHLQIKVEKLEEVLKVWSASKTLLLYVTVCNTFLIHQRFSVGFNMTKLMSY